MSTRLQTPAETGVKVPNGGVRLSRGRKLLFGAAFVALTCLPFLEIVARLALPPRQVSFGAVSVGDEADQRAFERTHPRTDTLSHAMNAGALQVPGSGGLRLRASTTVHIRQHALSHLDVTLRTNSIGYRSPEIGAKTRRRVLFLGDSITLADYLPEEQTFVRLVEQRSAERGVGLETLNAGVNGIGLQNELAILLDTGFGTAPDDVVVDLYLNDVDASPFVRPVTLPALLEWSRFVAEVAVRTQRWRVARAEQQRVHSGDDPRAAWLAEIQRDFPAASGDVRRDPAAFHGLVAASVGDWGAAWSRSVWVILGGLLDEVKRETDRRGVRLHVVMFPVRPQVEAEFLEDWPQQQARAWAESRQVPMLDLLPLFRAERDRPSHTLFFDQCHPTAVGNSLVADWISQYLLVGDGSPERPRPIASPHPWRGDPPREG